MDDDIPVHTGVGDDPQKRRHRRGLKRVQVACERCRSRKHKCDGNLPACHTCTESGARCVYIDRLTGSTRERTDRQVEELEKEAERLRQRVRELEARPQAICEASVVETHGGSGADARPPMGAASHALTSPSTSTRQTHSIAEEIDAVSRGMASEEKYVGESSGTFFGKVLQTVLLRSDYKQDPGRRKLPLRVQDRQQPHDHRRSPATLPQPQQAKTLRDMFVQNRWPSFPCLHMPSFDAQHLSKVCSDGYNAPPVSLFLVLLVFALGSLDLEQIGIHGDTSHHDYFATATSRYLDAVASEDNEHTVQGLTLLGIYALNEARRSLNGWHVAGQAVRMAIDLGFHRTLANSRLLDAEMRKRMFWCTYCLDRNFSIALGRPFAIRDEDIAIDLPLSLTDADLAAETVVSAPSSRTASTEPDLSTFIHVIRLRQLQSRVQQTFYPVSPCNSDPETIAICQAQLAGELDEWLRDTPQTRNGTHFRAGEWSQIAYSHTHLLLYRPNPAKPSVTRDALRICADSALTLITSYSSLYAKNKMIHTWIALHSIFMAAVTMLYTLWISADIRRSTRKTIVRSNVVTVIALFEALDDTWPLASRCRQIIENLGSATTALFDPSVQPGEHGTPSDAQARAITTEFLDWLNTQQAPGQQPSQETEASRAVEGYYDLTAPIDMHDLQFSAMQNLDDLFFQDFSVDFLTPMYTSEFSDAHA